jgi:MFS family permease
MMNPMLKSLFIGNSIFIFGGSLLVPVYALFATDIGASVVMTGLLFGAKFIATAVADLIIMKWPHWFKSTILVYQLSMFIRGAAWLCIGFYPSIEMLLIVQVITGLAEGFGTPAFSMLMANALDKGRQMQQWALWDLIKNPVLAASGIAGGYIVSNAGFPVLFYVMGVLALLGSIIPVDSKSVKRRKVSRYVRTKYRLLFSASR